MRKKSRKLLVLLGVVMLAACSSFVYPNDMPADFDFSVAYGVEGKQQVDTFTDTVVKDLVIDGIVEAEIPLTDEEMVDVYNRMVALDIMGKLDFEAKENAQCESEPEFLTEWHVQMNGEMKTIHYTFFCKDTKDSLQITQLQDYVHSIVTGKEAYKQLPESNGYYK